jgi:hypothetical protein
MFAEQKMVRGKFQKPERQRVATEESSEAEEGSKSEWNARLSRS